MSWFNFRSARASVPGYRLSPNAQVELASASAASSSTLDSLDFGPSQLELDQINDSLKILSDSFPEHSIDYMREALCNASPQSRLEIVANMLIEGGHSASPKRSFGDQPDGWQLQRSESYKNAVRRIIDVEFKLLSAGTRNSVLMENNFDFNRSRLALTELASKSYRVAFLSLFTSGITSPIPLRTGNTELDTEIVLLEESDQLDTVLQMREQLSAAPDAFFECQCCFGDVVWEETAFCSEGHYFCRTCLCRSVEEALNSGSTHLIDLEKASVKCISSATEGCLACVSPPNLQYFLPNGTFERLMERISKDNLDLCSSNTHLLRCPFCSYAVEDDACSFTLRTWRPLSQTHMFCFTLLIVSAYVPVLINANVFVGLTVLWLAIWIIIIPLLMNCIPSLALPFPVAHELTNYARKLRRPRWRKMLKCQNVKLCGKSSCLDCGREWKGFHKCDEGFDSEHAFVERKVDEAIKRICPQCNTSFVKDGGCNKMVCRCGYKMCYLCRADLRSMGYQHFCQHFRSVPWQRCTECDKCLVYDDPDEEKIIRRVRAKAKKQWRTRLEKDFRGSWEDDGGELDLDEREFAHAGHRLQGFDAWLYEMIMWIHGEEK